MVIQFKTVVDKDKVIIQHNRSEDGKQMLRKEIIDCPKNKDGTPDPISGIIGLLQEVRADPHMIFEIDVRITGAELGLSGN
jgi:hypothetical protein